MRTLLELGAPMDFLDKSELREELDWQTQEMLRQSLRGLKYLRFGGPAVTVSNSAFTINGSTTQGLGPREGYAWSIRRITVWGLTAGATPDVANLYRTSGSGSPPVWQFNGNNFAYTFGKTELLLLPGEHLNLINSGTITATGQISITGDALECAAEEIGKFF